MTTPHYPNEPSVDPVNGQPASPPSGQPPAQHQPTDGYPGQYSQPIPPGHMPGQYSQPYPPGTYPGQMPGQFSQPYPPGTYPSQMPGQSGQYSQPYPPGTYPGQMPGQFSQPFPSGTYPGQMPGQFSQPYPPGMYPGAQPWAVGVATMEPPVPQKPWYTWLPQPLPLWALLTLTGVLLLGMIAAFVMGTDWAAGGLHVGIVAGVAFVCVALATGVRSLAGMAAAANPARGRQLIGASLAGVLLLAVSGAGFGLPNPMHRLQASVLERGGQFAQSIKEYQLAGETAPGSHDIARVYDAWGEHETAATQFDRAVAHFDLVITTYTGATSEVQRAQADNVIAYSGWGKQATAAQDYASAALHFDVLLGQAYCQASCQTSVVALDATAYYHLAEQNLAKQDFATAVHSFTALQSRFPIAPEVGQIHADFAKALMGLGLQDRNGPTCSDAVQPYQQLALKFADTPQGKQAINDLKLPQRVIGHFWVSLPPQSHVVAFLGHNLNGTMSNSAFFAALFAQTPIKPDGSFAFAPQPQGTYSFFWAPVDNAGNILASSFYFNYDALKTDYYGVTVGPLCTADLGQLNVPIIHQSIVSTRSVLATHDHAILLDGPSAPMNSLFASTTRRV